MAMRNEWDNADDDIEYSKELNDPRLEKMFADQEQTPDEKAVREWLHENKHVFDKTWSSAEVAHMAITCGFKPEAVYAVMSFWRDAMDGTRFENRAAMDQYCFEIACEERENLEKKRHYVKELDLGPLWVELTNNTVTGEEQL